MNEKNYNNVTPYRATGNLNTAIANPSVNINDTMNVNIQSMATNVPPVNNVQNNNIQQNIASEVNNQTPIENRVPINTAPTQNPAPVNNTYQNTASNINVIPTVKVPTGANTDSSSSVKRTYVSSDNKPKKKTISLNLGPEFKTALLIIVILLVFIFLLPMISDIFNGY